MREQATRDWAIRDQATREQAMMLFAYHPSSNILCLSSLIPNPLIPRPLSLIA
jgi:hypothetical protein